MQKHLPKFEKRLADDLSTRDFANSGHGRPGVIMSFDSYRNIATVLLQSAYSDEVGELLEKVPCPTYMGIQTVAPEPGRPCFVEFKGKGNQHPIITTYYNHAYATYEHEKHYLAENLTPKSYLSY